MLATIWRKLGLGKAVQLRIMRFISDQFLIGVTGIILNKENKVLLLRHTYRATAWSLPGGYMKAKEHPTEGLERELEEETGFTVSADRLFKLRTDRDTGRLDLCYVGRYIAGEFKKSNEVDDYRFCSIDELPDIRRDQLLLINEALEYLKKRKTLAQ